MQEMDLDDQNEEYEAKRMAGIEKLKRDLDACSEFTPEQKKLLYEYIESLEDMNLGINAAHNRIRLRKKELKDLNLQLARLSISQVKLIEGIADYQESIASVFRETSATFDYEIKEQNKRIRHFFVGTVVLGMIIVAFLAFVSFGSKEMLDILNGMSTAIKFAQTII